MPKSTAGQRGGDGESTPPVQRVPPIKQHVVPEVTVDQDGGSSPSTKGVTDPFTTGDESGDA